MVFGDGSSLSIGGFSVDRCSLECVGRDLPLGIGADCCTFVLLKQTETR